MKTDASEVVDARSATIKFLDADNLDEEGLCEAMDILNADHALLEPVLPRLYGRVAWHLRAIGQYHRDLADRLEQGNRDFPRPRGPEAVRIHQRRAQECSEVAEKWAQASRDAEAHLRRRRLYVVRVQLPLPGLEPAT